MDAPETRPPCTHAACLRFLLTPLQSVTTVLSPHDFDLARRDTALPALATLLDPEAFTEALRRMIPLTGTTRPLYVRYKPGTNILVAFEVEGTDGPVIVHAKGHHPADRVKFDKAAMRSAVPGPLGPGRFVLEAEGIVVSVFPNDAKLKSLERLGDPERRGRLLARLFPGRPDLWGAELDLIRYKPERRYVACLRAGRVPVAALKFFTGTGFDAAYFRARMVAPSGPFRPVRLMSASKRHRIMAMEWLPGRVLSETLASENRGVLERVGAALAYLHASPGSGLPMCTRREEAHELRAVAENLAFLLPRLAPRIRATTERLLEVLGREPFEFRTLHGDFYAKQILVDGNEPVFLDFDRCLRGDPATDVGTFLAHLERDRLRGTLTEGVVAWAGEALLEGYRREVSGLDEARVRLATAAGLLRLAPHPFRFREPDWPERTEALLSRVEALLAPSAGVRGPTSAPPPPEDPAMPFLAEALDPDQIRRRFRRFLPRLGFTNARLHVGGARVVRHKPGRRCLIEYTLRIERPDGFTPLVLLGKVRAKGLDKTTYWVSRTLWHDGFHDPAEDGILIPEPIGCEPAFRMWLQRKVPGVTATTLLGDPDGRALAPRIAEALFKLHTSDYAPPRSHTLDDELRILHERLPLVCESRPSWRPRIERLLAACDRLGASLPTVRPRPIHRDCYPDNLLVDGPRLYLLDLDLACMGDPALDAGNLLAHVTEHSLRTTGDPSTLATWEADFEEAFTALHGEHTRAAVRAYATLSLVRHVHISTRMPERQGITEALLSLCEARLAPHYPTSLPFRMKLSLR